MVAHEQVLSATTDRSVPQRSLLSQRRKRLNRRLTGPLLVTPAVVLIVAFFFVPLVAAIVISLTNWPLFGSVHWVGLANYRELFRSAQFWHSLLFTVEFTVLVVSASVVLGYGLAHFMSYPHKLASVFRIASLVPVVLGITTISYMFVLELQPGVGAFDLVLSKLRLASQGTAFLIHPSLALVVIAAITVWAGLGFTSLLLMAGLQGIPTEVYEAASLDGAVGLARERYITLPLMRRTLSLVLILSVVSAFLVFSQFLILTGGGPGSSTTPLVLMIYSTAFSTGEVGYGTALSLIVFVILLVVSGLQFRLVRGRETED